MGDARSTAPVPPLEPKHMNRKAHWEQIYHARAPDEVSWFQARPEPSLALIDACALGPDAAILDVGGGASNLVDHLLAAGHRDVTVLDLAAAALARTRARLGPAAADVTWIEADVTRYTFSRAYDLWHDRAVLHFLIEADDRARYRRAVEQALRPGGWLVIGTFAPDGPERCSGLPVMRYGPESLQQLLGPLFRLEECRRVAHHTPTGAEQRFVFCRLQRSPR